jgi:competence protein ComEC
MNLKSYDRSDSEYNYLLSITNKTIPPNVFHKFFRYPAFLFSIWIIIGFFLQEYFNLSLLLIIVLFGLGFFGQIFLYKYSLWFSLANCLFWLMFAGFIHYFTYQIPINAFRLVQGTKVTYQGTIQRINEKYYLSKIESFSGYRPVLLLKNPELDLDQFLFQRVEVTGLFQPFLACSNPGSINLQTYWRRKRIFGEIQVYKCYPIGNNTFWNNFLSCFEQKRKALSNHWRIKLGIEYPYFAAMLWGEKNDLFQDNTVLLQETGIYHTFCISGLHLTILGGILFFVLQKIRCPKPLAMGTSILFCLLYLFFCSIAPSAFRAFLMFALYLVTKQIGRNTFSIHFISIAFLVMFFLQPEIIFQPGCQLSFVSTLAIILMSSLNPISTQSTKLLRWIINGTLLSTAVSLFTLPLLILNHLSFSSLIWTSNLILIPIAQLSILINFISIFVSWVPPLTNVFSHLIRFLIRILITLSEWSQNNIPHLFWNFDVEKQRIFGWVFWVSLSFLITLFMTKKIKIILLGSMIFLSLILILFGFSVQSQFQVWVLDVGQGLALVGLFDNQAICIDTGGVIRTYGNTGYTILLPFLKNYGIHQLQSVYLTHYHQDHTAGIQSLTEVYDVSGIYGRFENQLEGGIITTPIDSPTISKHHHPYQIEIIPISGFKENDQALVYRLSIQNFSCLVCGDIEEEGIHQLLKAGEDKIQSEVIIIPHHGSYTTNLAQLIRQVRPSLAIISTGENRYGHPDQRTLKLLNDLEIPYYRTDSHGAVGFLIQRTNWKGIVHGKNDFSKMDHQ